MTYQIEIPEQRRAAVQQAIDRLLSGGEHTCWRDDCAQPFDLHASLDHLQWAAGRLAFSLRATGQAQARPRDVLAALGLADLEDEGMWLIRTEVQLAEH